MLFVYKRLDSLKKCILALQQNKLAIFSPLIIYSDAAKSIEDKAAIEDVRAYIKEITGFKSLKIIFREENYGLSRSILSGIDEVFLQYDRLIVLEDDIIVSKIFLNYMNYGLQKFENDKNIGSINSYTEVKFSKPYIALGADCWGWATWKNRWISFEKNSSILFEQINYSQKLKKEIIKRSHGFYYNMLIDQIKGNIDSWAIRWYMYNFINNLHGLYPATSLVNNIGSDDMATHKQLNLKYTNLDDSNANLDLIIKFNNLKEDKVIISKLTMEFKKIYISYKLNNLLNMIKMLLKLK